MSHTASDALTKYWEVRALPEFQSERIVDYAVKHNHIPSSARAYTGLAALLQVLSLLSERDHAAVPLVLQKGDVYSMYNALREMNWGDNQSFDHFCHKHFQAYHLVHHLDQGGLTTLEVTEAGGVVYTLGQLEGMFDTELDRELRGWISDYQKNQFQPAAILWVKRYVGEMLPTQHQTLSSIIERWNLLV